MAQQTKYVDSDHFVVPGNGTVLTAPVDTAAFDIAKFDPTVASTFTGWDLIGGTSKENLPAFEKDGGDATQLHTWEQSAAHTTYEPVSLSVTVNMVRVARENLELAFPAGAWNEAAGEFKIADFGTVEKALFILMIDGQKRAGFYMPRVALSLGDMPELDAENFFELQILGQIMTSAKTHHKISIFQPTAKSTTAASPGVGA